MEVERHLAQLLKGAPAWKKKAYYELVETLNHLSNQHFLAEILIVAHLFQYVYAASHQLHDAKHSVYTSMFSENDFYHL